MGDPTGEGGRPQASTGIKGWLFNPFTYVAGGRSLALGVTAILAASLIGSYSNTHFDGVLDLHTGRSAAVKVFVIEGVVDWLALAIVLCILGKVVSRTAFRAIDLFGTQAMARWPTVIIAAVALAPPYRRYVAFLPQKLMGWESGVEGPMTDAVVFGLVLLVSVLAVIWMVTLMYRSYSVCCNVKGGKAIGTFIGGLLGAEVLSKLALLPILMR